MSRLIISTYYPSWFKNRSISGNGSKKKVGEKKKKKKIVTQTELGWVGREKDDVAVDG